MSDGSLRDEQASPLAVDAALLNLQQAQSEPGYPAPVQGPAVPPQCRMVERSPAMCAMAAAARRGFYLTRELADEIATAVLDYAEDEYRVRLEFAAGYREHALAQESRLRSRLAAEVMQHAMLPTGEPEQIVSEPPPSRPWEVGYMELVVPVRSFKPQSRFVPAADASG